MHGVRDARETAEGVPEGRYSGPADRLPSPVREPHLAAYEQPDPFVFHEPDAESHSVR